MWNDAEMLFKSFWISHLQMMNGLDPSLEYTCDTLRSGSRDWIQPLDRLGLMNVLNIFFGPCYWHK